MKVYPTKESALLVKHPNGNVITVAGADWPDDGFTFRMIAQGIFTENPTEVYRAPAPVEPPPKVSKDK